MGEGATPLLEGLAWVTSLLWFLFIFFIFFKSQQSVFKNLFKNKEKLFGQRKMKPVSWSLVGFTKSWSRKGFAQVSENSTLIID